jgi:homospermidine synthase
MSVSNIVLPKNIFIMGYGAIGKCFTEILLKNFKNANIKVCDLLDLKPQDNRFDYLKMKVNSQNINELSKYVEKGDIVVDLSTNIDVLSIWPLMNKQNVMYLNTAMEEWEDSSNPVSFPKSIEEMYKSSLGYRHEQVQNNKYWMPDKGVTTVFEHGMNPGLISHFAKDGLLNAAKYFLTRKDWTDIDHKKIEKYLSDKNYPKLAQAMGLHTIHCSEHDNQSVLDPPKDLKQKFYNTWSCRGFLTEGMVPIQIAQGSHEDETSQELPRLKDNSVIMSWAPSNHYWGT